MREQTFEQGYYLAESILPTAWIVGAEALMGVIPMTIVEEVRQTPAIVNLARELIGPDLADTLERTVHYKPERIYDQWHHDIPWDSLDGEIIPCWRFAVYFTDYTKHSGALSVIPGSHLMGNPLGRTPEDFVAIQSTPGDVVIWNLRTAHKPNTTVRDLPFAPNRNAIIFDYAAPGVELERYKSWRLPKRIKEGRA